MSYALWDFLSGIPGIVVMVLAVHLLAGYRKGIYIPAHMLLVAASSFLRLFGPPVLSGFFWIIGMIVFILPAALLCRGRVYWRVLCTGLVLLANMLADYLAYMAALAFFPNAITGPSTMPISVLLFGKGVCAVILILLCLLMLALKPSTLDATQTSINRKFFLFPVSQVFVLGTLYGYIYWYKAGAPLIAFGVASFLFCVAADVGMFLALRGLNRKHVVELENAALQSQLASQISYYDQLLSGMEKIRRLRHDYGNQLQTIHTLLAAGNAADAKIHLNALGATVGGYGAAEYTDNPVADAVLIDKAHLCKEKNIPFSVKAELSTRLSVDGVDLCSVLSNLLDNAIHACEGIDEKERFIDLSAAVRSGYLIIKVKNSSIKSEDVKEPTSANVLTAEHGLGLQILQSIADKYSGKLEASQNEESYESTVWLLLDEE